MAKCISTLMQKIPWTKDSGGLQSMESQRVLPLSTAHTAPADSSNKGYYSPSVATGVSCAPGGRTLQKGEQLSEGSSFSDP